MSETSEKSLGSAWYLPRMDHGFEYFAACAPGLEPLLEAELVTLGARPRIVTGGVEFGGDRVLFERAQLWLGTASHVLRRCAEFRCRALGELERKVAELDVTPWADATASYDVRASARHSRVYHTSAIVRHFRAGLARALGDKRHLQEPSADVELPCFAVRFYGDVCTISLDPSPSPLHRRGYRLATGKAPLREDLAHALVLASGWRDDEALLDPFCGSGTIAIEGARLAAGIPPGALRPRNASLDLEATAATPTRTGLIAASDRDELAAENTRANADRAGVLTRMDVRAAAVSSHPWLAKPADAPERGVLICNPPFGKRVPGGDLRSLYQTLGHRFLALGPGWRLVLLASDPRWARAVGFRLERLFTTRHGGISITAFQSAASSPASNRSKRTAINRSKQTAMSSADRIIDSEPGADTDTALDTDTNADSEGSSLEHGA
jgi:putative N6-adenine-specific DNA methylase